MTWNKHKSLYPPYQTGEGQGVLLKLYFKNPNSAVKEINKTHISSLFVIFSILKQIKNVHIR